MQTQSKQEQVIEGNKLINGFRGVKLGQPGYVNDYHSNWNRLMPVVEKIALYRYPEYWPSGKPRPQDADYYEDCAYLRTFGMRDTEGNYMVRINAQQVHHATTLIEAAWQAVVQFIHWYNSLNK